MIAIANKENLGVNNKKSAFYNALRPMAVTIGAGVVAFGGALKASAQVIGQTPAHVATAISPLSIYGHTVAVNGVAGTYGGARLTDIIINFGDGTVREGMGNVMQAVHTYAHDGIYTVSVVARDNLNETSTAAWQLAQIGSPVTELIARLGDPLTFVAAAGVGILTGVGVWIYRRLNEKKMKPLIEASRT